MLTHFENECIHDKFPPFFAAMSGSGCCGFHFSAAVIARRESAPAVLIAETGRGHDQPLSQSTAPADR